ncbi:hypothetical protein ASG31_04660 [Chryseobacterium sp. Leaf404]|nr:hypothetical protein ASG31_04660 [Chryseobacterium sp. Leaf404]
MGDKLTASKVSFDIFYYGDNFRPPFPLFCATAFSLAYKKSSTQVGSQGVFNNNFLVNIHSCFNTKILE